MPNGLALIGYELVSMVDIDSSWDRAHWFGIDQLLACVHVDITAEIVPIGLAIINN